MVKHKRIEAMRLNSYILYKPLFMDAARSMNAILKNVGVEDVDSIKQHLNITYY